MALLVVAAAGCSSDPEPSGAGPGTTSGPCAASQTDCGGVCVVLTQDPSHCGACNSPCAAGHSCVSGSCVTSVPSTGGTGGSPGVGGLDPAGGSLTGGAPVGGELPTGGALPTGGVPATGGASPTGGVENTGGAGVACTNRRPTGTEWDAATCDDWATRTNECDADWMIDGGFCDESCGRCTPTNTGGAGGTGGVPGTGAAPNTGGVPNTGGTSGGLPKFVGNITTHDQVNTGGLTYATYWDQITPENAGKWGSVQSTASSAFNWSTLDAIYDYTESNGIIFKQHAFVWGPQQPGGAVPTQDQVIHWIQSFCARYPNTALIDVVNEPPPHTEPNYAGAIGGGTNGDWQWITNSFKWARQYCPGAILILNDFNNIEWSGDNQHFIDIVNTVRENGGPIDAVGAQAHDLDHASVTPQSVSNLLRKLHDDTGLPVYVTEMDLSYSDDQQQLSAYQQYFPMFMDADFVPGITIWGWIHGSTWDLAPDSGLVRNGRSRPAMTWLMDQLRRPAP